MSTIRRLLLAPVLLSVVLFHGSASGASEAEPQTKDQPEQESGDASDH